MIERRASNSPLKDQVLTVIKRLLRQPNYREVYKTLDSSCQMPVKENYKGDVLIGIAPLALLRHGFNYLKQEYTPSFAKGRCRIIGEGAYKTVVVDQDGKDNEVIKLYNYHVYDGKGAREKAEAAAEKISIIHEIAKIIAPGYVLPYEMVIDRNGSLYTVCERQQRAETVHFNFFDPRTAERLHREATNTVINGTRQIEQELLKRGLARVNPFTNMILDDFSLTEIHWDLITNHLVSLDIVDQVDIIPLFNCCQSKKK